MKGSKYLNVRSACGLALMCLVLVHTCPTSAQIYTISAPNASLSGNNSGIVDWVVDGVDYLNLQAGFVRIGSSGPETLLTGGTYNASAGSVTYNPLPGLTVTYLMTLSSATYPPSQLNQSITFQNTSASAMNLHFFLYNDFNISASDTATIIPAAFPRTGYRSALQLGGTGGVSQLITSAILPTRADAAAAGTTLAQLNDGAATTLGNTLSAGPGDVAWAFQWDFSLAAGSPFTISTLASVPEPSVGILAGLGLLLLGLRGRK